MCSPNQANVLKCTKNIGLLKLPENLLYCMSVLLKYAYENYVW